MPNAREDHTHYVNKKSGHDGGGRDYNLRHLQSRADELRRDLADIESRVREIKRIHPILLKAQHAEYTEHHIYQNLSRLIDDRNKKEQLDALAEEKYNHYHFWKRHTGTASTPPKWKIRGFTLLARMLGFTFVLRLMEGREAKAEAIYRRITRIDPGMEAIQHEENGHKHKLMDILEDYNLAYASSVVLGLNDALVELTGAIAGGLHWPCSKRELSPSPAW